MCRCSPSRSARDFEPKSVDAGTTEDQDDQEPELRGDGGRELPIGTLVVDRAPADEESGTELIVIDHPDERAADVETVVGVAPSGCADAHRPVTHCPRR